MQSEIMVPSKISIEANDASNLVGETLIVKTDDNMEIDACNSTVANFSVWTKGSDDEEGISAIFGELKSSAGSQDYDGQSSELHASIRQASSLALPKAVESSRNSKEVTTKMLDTTFPGLVGRDKEKLTLKECYQRLCANNDPKENSEESGEFFPNELVFIQGYSGIGKSVLARAVQEDFAPNSNEVYVEGKYEFSSTDEPYTGLSQAFGKLCNEFKDCPSDVRDKISSEIKKNMAEEAYMLMGMIPEISVFLESKDTLSLSFRESASGREHERWKYAFRTFTRILGSHFAPITIMLDDLQWADISSLDIMDYLISDVQNPHPLMIIGCYRSNEVDENSILYNRTRTLEGKSQRRMFQLTDIKLENCSLDSVNKIIMSMMSIDDETETRKLAEVCFKRTLGNPFFLVEFMGMLQREGLVKFNSDVMKWFWDVDEIENATMSAANVVDLLKARMEELSANAQLLLQYAACLGASFSVTILKHIWSQHACVRLVRATDDIDSILEMIQEVKLVEPCGPDELRWVHDKIQETALSLSNLVCPEFQCDLGLFLYESLDSDQLEKKLFDVADLVNKGKVARTLDIAVLNLRAATKARKMAAISSAATYADFGIRQLGDEKWTLHRTLALQLYSISVEMEYALGHIYKAEEYIEIILARDEFNAMEKMPLQKKKALLLATAHLKWHEACDYGLVILKDLGFNFVWNKALVPVQMLTAINKLKKRVKKVKVEDIENMKLIKDKKQVAVIEMTLDHGVSLCSADCFATFGGVLMFLFKDHAAASHVCDLAFAFQKRSGRRYIADTMHGAWAFILVQTMPLEEGLILTMEGYSQGLRDGDPLDATNCLINHFVLLPYMMGRPLGTIMEEFPKIEPQLEESGITNNILTLKVWWQMMVNLTLPPSEVAKKLEGEQFRQSEETAESNMYIGNMNLAIGELLLFCGDHEQRAKRLLGEEKGKTYSELVQGYPPHGIETFHRGITWYAMARKTGNRKYKSKARGVKKEIAKWVEKGNPNVQDYDLLLNAEDAVLRKKYKRADGCYMEAIAHATRMGHMSHAALYNERFAEYLLEVRGDRDDYEYHLQKAIRFYTDWGAIGKANILKQKMVHSTTSVYSV